MPALPLVFSIAGGIALAVFASERPRASPMGAFVIGMILGLLAAIIAEIIWKWLFAPKEEKKEGLKLVGKAAGMIGMALVAQGLFALVFYGLGAVLLSGLLGW
jgi:hypothetical protein